jgi:hypothetical protein
MVTASLIGDGGLWSYIYGETRELQATEFKSHVIISMKLPIIQNPSSPINLAR